jgi:predicted P-loop ATPase
MPMLSKYSTEAAVQQIADSNSRSELKEWLESLKWDGVIRSEDFLTNAYGVDKNDYVRAISRNWLIGLVARGIKPGCKFDEMLILEGDQGTYKSTSIKALAGNFAAESNADLSTKDFMQELTGTWIVEFDELDQFRKAESTLIKKKLSQQSDRYRPPYGRNVVDVPRTCVFVGTTNQSTYLKDETGGRRFWPICVKKADLNYILENREQLFAEAVALFKQGHSWHEVPESAKQEQEARREQDPWEEVIADYLQKNNGNIIIGNPNPPFEPMISKLTAQNIAKYILNVPIERYDKSVSLRIGRCFRALGYEMKTVRDDTSQDLLGYGKVSKVFLKKMVTNHDSYKL